MLIASKRAEYQVKNQAANSANYRLYVVNDGSHDLLMRIPTDISGNGSLEREAFVLDHLAKMSTDYETDYANSHGNSGKKLHYDWLFPSLVDSFIPENQGNRRANIMALTGTEVSLVAPLIKFKVREKVDAKTTIWVLGRLLKLQSFVNEVDLDYDFSETEVLINPQDHHVIYLGWTNAKFSETINPRTNIKAAAQSILDWGAENGTEGEADYFKLLENLAKHGTSNAFKAFEELYALADSLWGERKYHPYTAVIK